MSKNIIIYAVDYTDVHIEISGTDTEGKDHCDDKFETWEEARDSIIDYHETIILNANMSIKEAKKLKNNL